MPDIARTAIDMISGMMPVLQPGVYVFVSIEDPARVADLASHAVATFREAEGLSLIIPIDVAMKARQSIDQPMRCITLNVYSSLEGVGLTAAVATALGEKGIPCNMIAAFHHDHVFVPSELSDRAMEVLIALQKRAAKEL